MGGRQLRRDAVLDGVGTRAWTACDIWFHRHCLPSPIRRGAHTPWPSHSRRRRRRCSATRLALRAREPRFSRTMLERGLWGADAQWCACAHLPRALIAVGASEASAHVCGLCAAHAPSWLETDGVHGSEGREDESLS